MKIEWLPNGEDESVPRCPNCELTGESIPDIAERLFDKWFCLSCHLLLEEE